MIIEPSSSAVAAKIIEEPHDMILKLVPGKLAANLNLSRNKNIAYGQNGTNTTTTTTKMIF